MTFERKRATKLYGNIGYRGDWLAEWILTSQLVDIKILSPVQPSVRSTFWINSITSLLLVTTRTPSFKSCHDRPKKTKTRAILHRSCFPARRRSARVFTMLKICILLLLSAVAHGVVPLGGGRGMLLFSLCE